MPTGSQSQQFGGWGDGGGAFGQMSGRGAMGGSGTEQIQQLAQQIAHRVAQQIVRQQIVATLTQQQPGVAQQIEQLEHVRRQAQLHPAVQLLLQQPAIQQAAQQMTQQLAQSGVLYLAQQIAQQLVQQLMAGQQQGFGQQQGLGQQGFGQFGQQQPQFGQQQPQFGLSGGQLYR
ncbi:MAG TPA: hypothetical protein VFT95_02510 [Micromonosporaceae bacterium]|nr:hypothetical protein [Micromonosporaceae bacterium]